MYYLYKWFTDKPTELTELLLICGLVELVSETVLVLSIFGVIK